jgi:hypothetical protein
LEPRKLHRSVLQQSQAKMRAHSQHPSTAEFTVIAIAAAGGGTAVATAAASATGADILARLWTLVAAQTLSEAF